jgi:hypothetical protein
VHADAAASQAVTLWDGLPSLEAHELAGIDELLGEPGLPRPIAEHWRREEERRGRAAAAGGRPTFAMSARSPRRLAHSARARARP